MAGWCSLTPGLLKSNKWTRLQWLTTTMESTMSTVMKSKLFILSVNNAFARCSWMRSCRKPWWELSERQALHVDCSVFITDAHFPPVTHTISDSPVSPHMSYFFLKNPSILSLLTCLFQVNLKCLFCSVVLIERCSFFFSGYIQRSHYW